MTYLLDVNMLLALGFKGHLHNSQAEAWLHSKVREANLALATCPITELGFVRIALGVAAFGTTVETAKEALGRLKANSRIRFVFLTDSLGVDNLPSWVRSSTRTTDGHLAALATVHGAKLVTFDRSIPGAELIS